MFEPLVSFIVERAVDVLPRWLALWLAPPERIARQVEIDLRRVNPVNITLRAEVPNVSLWFRISNMSPVDLVLDRLLVEFWVGQPTLQGAVLDRLRVPRGKSLEDVHFWQDLGPHQQEQVRGRVKDGLLSVPVHLYLKAYFESKVGPVSVNRRLEHPNVPVQP